MNPFHPDESHSAIVKAPSFGAVMRLQAARRPTKRVFSLLENGERETQSLTYAELEDRALTLAGMLIERGLSGQRAVLAYPTCLDFIVAVFGCFVAGVVAVPAPIAPRGNAFARVRAILADCDAAAILSLSSLLDEESRQPEALSTAAGTLCIATDTIEGAGACTLPEIDPGAIALLQYTSGSTGNPRGVMITHANLMHQQRVLASVLHAGPDDSAVSWLPLYHDMGLIGAVLHSAYVGGSCVLMPPLSFLQRPMRWLQAMSKFRATISMAPCFAYDLCAQRAASSDVELDLSRWRAAICGGEVVRPHVIEKFTTAFHGSGFDEKAMLPAYGLAEATLLATSVASGKGATTVELGATTGPRRFVSCGIAFEGQRLAIVDPASGIRVREGETGEVWLQGGGVAAGYWNRPEETRSAFRTRLADDIDAGSWLRTGDLGVLTSAGLVVTGRLKELIVIRGTNFDPGDIEATARDSDAVLAAGDGGAFSIDGDEGEALVLLHEVGRSALKTVDGNSVAASVAEAISKGFGLTLYDLVLLRPGSLPRTTSGKIQRHVCRERYLAGELVSVAPIDHPSLGRCRPRKGAPA